MTDVRAFAAQIDAEMPALLATTERVVNIDSGTYHAAGVNAVIDIWAGMLTGMGFALERRKVPDRGDQLTARLAMGTGSRILVLGHADTVWPAGTVASWPFARDGDRLTGPGIGDMKTNVVMALHALGMLLRGGLKGIGSITVLIVPDEEIGSPQSRAWIETEARSADVCLTLEPSRPNGGMVVGRGAVGAAYINAKGVTAHSGSFRAMGASAVSALSPLVTEIEALGSVEEGNYTTVGVFRGGAARQVVPDSAEIHLDIRAPNDASAAALWRDIKRIAERPAADPRVTIALTGGLTRPAFPDLPAMHALYGLAEGFAKELGAPITKVVSRGGSDGSFAAQFGVPSLDGIGPICHDVCSRREWIELSSIAPRGAIFAGLIASVAQGWSPHR